MKRKIIICILAISLVLILALGGCRAHMLSSTIRTSDNFVLGYHTRQVFTGCAYSPREYSVIEYFGDSTELVIPLEYRGRPIVGFGVRRTDYDEFVFGNQVRKLTIQRNIGHIHYISTRGFEQMELAEVYVTSDNQAFKSIDGVLFTSTASILMFYPPAKVSETFVIPKTVTAVGFFTVAGSWASSEATMASVMANRYLKNLYIPSTEFLSIRLDFERLPSLENIFVPYSLLNTYREFFEDNADLVQSIYETLI
ncbi:MAG: hypothetical protein FWE13_05550 [Firmicutes bacterium]|nr:hypothetical protein [Bacillota bacterium]